MVPCPLAFYDSVSAGAGREVVSVTLEKDSRQNEKATLKRPWPNFPVLFSPARLTNFDITYCPRDFCAAKRATNRQKDDNKIIGKSKPLEIGTKNLHYLSIELFFIRNHVHYVLCSKQFIASITFAFIYTFIRIFSLFTFKSHVANCAYMNVRMSHFNKTITC